MDRRSASHSTKNSGKNAYYTAFYADCEHTLEPVTKGLRLVLAFNLVRGVESSVPIGPSASSQVGAYTDLLVAAAQQWCEDKTVQKFALPLAHKYTRTNVSFAGLKGTDLSTATLLQNATHPATGEKLFSVYLALVTKVESGTSDAEHDSKYSRRAPAMDTDCPVRTSYETKLWVAPSGAIDFNSLSVDFNRDFDGWGIGYCKLPVPGDFVGGQRGGNVLEKPVNFLFRFTFSGFNHESSSNRETHCWRVESIIH